MNLKLVNREFKKNNEPDVIRRAKYELNVSTFVFSSGFEHNCQYNTKKELQHTVTKSTLWKVREEERQHGCFDI